MLQRKCLILESQNSSILDYNWNYPLTINLFNKITLFNKEFANFLHNEGFRSKDAKKKKFKLINYMLLFKNQQMKKEGIKIKNKDEVVLIISGYKEPINAILQGLSIDNNIIINDTIFKVVNVEDDKIVKFNKINIYRAMIPIVESKFEEGKVKYLNPYNPEFYNAIKQNLKRKYEVIYNKPYQGQLKLMIENMLKIKKKSIKVKNGYIQGYSNFEILVQADKDMQKIAYYCGIGANSLGLGLVNYVTGGE